MSEAETAVAPNGAAQAIAEPTASEKYDGAAIRSERKEEAKAKEPEAVEKRPGYDPVDIETASPEQVKERINYLYRQVKDKDKREREVNRILADQSRVIAELTAASNTIVSHIQTKTLDDGEEQLTAVMNSAFERGDNRGYLDAQKKLVTLRVEKELLQRQPKAQPQTQPAQQTNGKYNSASQIANDASGEGYLSSEEVRLTEAWQNERDENGNFLRPWTRTSDVNNPDPAFSAALREAQGVFTNPRFANATYEEKLAEVDRRMGVAKRVTGQTVSATGLTGRGKNTKITLSADIEKMVRHTKWGGSKYKTDDERLDAYRKQLSAVKKGAR